MAEPEWHLWRAFLAVSRAGSLSAAARALGLTQPTLSRQIATLEESLGVALFTRSPSGLLPTERALALAPHAEAMAAAAAALTRAASGEPGEPAGTVRVAASEFVGGVVLPPMLEPLAARHPGLEIELSLSDRTEDLLRRDADLAVRNVPPTQGALVVRRLGEAPVRFFAHRRYLAAHGHPESVHDLPGHRLIGRDAHLRQVAPQLGLPALRFGFRCESDLGLMAALRAGLGIGYCQVGVGLRDPDLVPVLPDVVLARIGVWLVMHEDLRRMRRVRLVFDHLAAALAAHLDGVPDSGEAEPPT